MFQIRRRHRQQPDQVLAVAVRLSAELRAPSAQQRDNREPARG
jgi:hypothetical protein